MMAICFFYFSKHFFVTNKSISIIKLLCSNIGVLFFSQLVKIATLYLTGPRFSVFWNIEILEFVL